VEQHRQGETGLIPFRTGRFFNVGANWFFATREAIDQGPFPTRIEAEKALVNYIEKCCSVERNLGI
jgi:hypothetical protein